MRRTARSSWRRRRTRTRLRSRAGGAALVACAALAGCGGDGETAEPPPPSIEPAVAEELAQAADRVANLLANGDTCGAAHAADDLQDAVVAAVNEGSIPPELQEQLGTSAGELVNTVNCPPPETDTVDEGGGDDGEDDD
jgi:hypothetical protein